MSVARLIFTFAAAGILSGVSGCGVSFDVTVHNHSDSAMRVELCSVGDQGDLYPAATGDVSPGTAFEYSMRDGPRGADRVVRVSRIGDGPDATPAIADVHVGERLLPWANEFEASFDPPGGVQLRRVLRGK